jgi:hypothetical protein
VKRPGHEVEEAPVIGVASVYTPAQNRGKGYCGAMMRLLSQRVRSLTGGRGFSVLYSDIGPDFYNKNGGWRTCDAVQVIIPSSKSFDDASSVELLTLQSAKDTIDKDIELLKDEIHCEDDWTTIQMIPQHSELEWAVIGDKHSVQHLNMEESGFVGATVGSAEEWGYILWFHERKEDCLTILRLRHPPSDLALKGLIGAALVEARKSGLGKVKLWSPSERVERVSGIEKVARSDSLPCLHYFNEEETVRWRSIEKLGWCE